MTKEKYELSAGNFFSIYYHSIFEYPLNFLEIIKWEPGGEFEENLFDSKDFSFKNGLFFFKKAKGSLFSREVRKRYSSKKLKVAREAAGLLGKIPTVKMVGVTGSLAMLNAEKNSDIDLCVISQKNTLWSTRLLSFFLLKIHGFALRRFGDRNEKDKLCINIWMDYSWLTWPRKDRSFYTAHEIAQIIPLFNKDNTYQHFLLKNAWIKDFWPNTARIKKTKNKSGRDKNFSSFLMRILNRVLFNLQFLYMRSKKTREIIRINRAVFHPIDRGLEVNEKLVRFISNTHS